MPMFEILLGVSNPLRLAHQARILFKIGLAKIVIATKNNAETQPSQ